MVNKEQIKKLSDTLTVIAYAQFGVFGYSAWQAGDYVGTFISGSVFVWLQAIAIWILGFPKEKQDA
jgi:hypothetical protein